MSLATKVYLFYVAFIFTLLFCLAARATAGNTAFYCEWKGGNITFATSLDSKAVSIHRYYDRGTDKVYVFIPLLDTMDMPASVTLEHGGNKYVKTASCIYAIGD